MFEIKLIEPNALLVEFYNKLWSGIELQSYKTHILRYGEANSSMSSLTINDVRPLVYDSDKGITSFKDGDKEITNAIEKAKTNNEFGEVVTRINGIYHTRTSRNVVDTLNSNWDEIKKSISSIKSENDAKESRKKRNDVIDIIADGKGKSNRYSFATKFCSFVSSDLFPIFDSVSSTLLYAYLKDSGYNINRDYMGIYRYYLEAYDTFIEEFHLQGKSYKEIDKYLWLYGTAISKCTQSTCLISFSSPSYIPKTEAGRIVTEEITKTTLSAD